MKAIEKFRNAIKRNRIAKKLLEQYGYKTTFFAVVSLIINTCYAVFNGVLGVLESSVWYGVLAGYYVLLIIFRGTVIFTDVKCRKKFADADGGLLKAQYKIYLGSGAFLVVVEIAMCLAVTQMVLSNHPFRYGEIAAISTATYTFYKITMSVINLVKAKKFANPVTQSLINLNFADACMATASLTVLLLATFGEDGNDAFMLPLKACVGFAACALTLAVATAMIIKACKMLNKEKCDKDGK